MSSDCWREPAQDRNRMVTDAGMGGWDGKWRLLIDFVHRNENSRPRVGRWLINMSTIFMGSLRYYLDHTILSIFQVSQVSLGVCESVLCEGALCVTSAL